MLDTCLVGYGRIAQGLSEDKSMVSALGELHTHYAVLFEHPEFHMRGIVDLGWESWDKGFSREECEMAVIATPPGTRLDIVKTFPNLRKVLFEKPLGLEAESLLKYCEDNGVRGYVNYWRRADTLISSLASGGLRKLVGQPQRAVAVYTRELHHLVNLSQFLGVEPVYVYIEGHPYREVSLEVWGTDGLLRFTQELQVVTLYERGPCRSLDGAEEIAGDRGTVLEGTLDRALWEMYSGIARGDAVGTLEEGVATEVAVRAIE